MKSKLYYITIENYHECESILIKYLFWNLVNKYKNTNTNQKYI